MTQPGYHVITSTSVHVECMCARGRARDSVTRGVREPTSVAMATFQQSNWLQIASCISFPSPCPHPLSFHGLFASLRPSLCPIWFFFYLFFFWKEEGGGCVRSSFFNSNWPPCHTFPSFSQHYEATLIYLFILYFSSWSLTNTNEEAGCFSFLRVIVWGIASRGRTAPGAPQRA